MSERASQQVWRKSGVGKEEKGGEEGSCRKIEISCLAAVGVKRHFLVVAVCFRCYCCCWCCLLLMLFWFMLLLLSLLLLVFSFVCRCHRYCCRCRFYFLSMFEAKIGNFVFVSYYHGKCFSPQPFNHLHVSSFTHMP